MSKSPDVEFIPADQIDETEAATQTHVTVARDPWEDMLRDLQTGRTQEVTIPVPKGKTAMVAAFHNAFQMIGGTPRLALWADENPTEFFKLYGKLLPRQTEIDAKHDGKLKILHVLPPTDLDK